METTMSYESIKFKIENGIALLTLSRPDRLNSFTQAMHLEVRDALTKVQADKSVRVLVLTGAGRGFCAGQDLSDRAVDPGAPSVDLGESVEKFYAPLVLTLKNLPLPVICAVNGVAAGFIAAFSNLGLIPDTGGTWHLPRLIGHARAMGLAMLGEKLSAEKAEEWGLIWRCVPDEALMDEAMAMAEHFAAAPTKGLAFTKKAFQASYANSLEDQLQLEAGMMRELGYSHDYREGVSAFMAKRNPHFKGE